jgi:hypothetical protein
MLYQRASGVSDLDSSGCTWFWLCVPRQTEHTTGFSRGVTQHSVGEIVWLNLLCVAEATSYLALCKC